MTIHSNTLLGDQAKIRVEQLLATIRNEPQEIIHVLASKELITPTPIAVPFHEMHLAIRATTLNIKDRVTTTTEIILRQDEAGKLLDALEAYLDKGIESMRKHGLLNENERTTEVLARRDEDDDRQYGHLIVMESDNDEKGEFMGKGRAYGQDFTVYEERPSDVFAAAADIAMRGEDRAKKLRERLDIDDEGKKGPDEATREVEEGTSPVEGAISEGAQDEKP